MGASRTSLMLCCLALAGCGSAGSTATPTSPHSSDHATPTTTPVTEPVSTSTSAVIRPASPLPSDSPPIAYVAQGPRLIAVDVRSARAKTTLADFGPRTSLDWVTYDAPRRRVFFGVSSGCDPGVNGIWVVGIDGRGLRKVAQQGLRASVSPDGTHLAFPVPGDGCGVQWIFVHDLASGKEQRFERPGGAGEVDGVAWIDNRSLYFSSPSTGVRTLDTTKPESPPLAGEKPKRGRVDDAVDHGYVLQRGCTPDAPPGCESTLSVTFTRSRPGYQFGPIANPIEWSVDDSGAHALVILDEPTGDGANSRSVVWIVGRAGRHTRLVEAQAADW